MKYGKLRNMLISLLLIAAICMTGCGKKAEVAEVTSAETEETAVTVAEEQDEVETAEEIGGAGRIRA